MYKYNPPSNLEHIFINKTICFTQPAKFNDPFECSPVLDEVVSKEWARAKLNEKRAKVEKEALAKLPKFKRKEARANLASLRVINNTEVLQGIDKFNEQYKEMFQAKIKSVLNENLGILCLSSNCSSELMWSHYGKDHTGFLIEFDPINEYFHVQKNVKDSLRHLRKVDYLSERIKYSLESLSEESLFLNKSECWKYESEYRFVKSLSDLQYVPEKRIYTESFPFEAIKRVVFGVNCDPQMITKYTKIIRENYGHIVVQKSVLSTTEFGFSYCDV